MTNEKLIRVAVELIAVKTALFQVQDRQHYVDLPVLMQATQMVMQGMIFAESSNNNTFDQAVATLREAVQASVNPAFISVCRNANRALASTLSEMYDNAKGCSGTDAVIPPDVMEQLIATFGTSSKLEKNSPHVGKIFILAPDGELVSVSELAALDSKTMMDRDEAILQQLIDQAPLLHVSIPEEGPYGFRVVRLNMERKYFHSLYLYNNSGDPIAVGLNFSALKGVFPDDTTQSDITSMFIELLTHHAKNIGFDFKSLPCDMIIRIHPN